MIQVRGVCKTYNGQPALRASDLDLVPGETTVLIGPSGCGKSTLLRIIVGLVEPDAGQVNFHDEPVSRKNILSVRRRLGYVIQEGGLFPHLCVRDNAAVMARHVGWGEPRIDERLNELCELTHFPADALGRFPMEISGGQRQRVGLMRALMLDPEVLLLDEPLGALDPIVRGELQTDLKRIFAELHKTVVMVTHDLAEAAYFGRRIVLLREGRIVQQGSFQELLDEPAETFVTEFVNAQRSPLTALEAGRE